MAQNHIIIIRILWTQFHNWSSKGSCKIAVNLSRLIILKVSQQFAPDKHSCLTVLVWYSVTVCLVSHLALWSLWSLVSHWTLCSWSTLWSQRWHRHRHQAVSLAICGGKERRCWWGRESCRCRLILLILLRIEKLRVADTGGVTHLAQVKWTNSFLNVLLLWLSTIS